MIVARSRGARAPYILVLEDLDDIANLLREELRARGYRCFSLRSKAAAERFLNRVRPDLVMFVDCMSFSEAPVSRQRKWPRKRTCRL